MDNVNLFAKNLSIIQATEESVGQGFTWSLDANQSLRLASYDATDRSLLSPIMYMNSNGQVGIGTDTPDYNLHVVGSARVQGELYNISDIRYKTDLQPIQDALAKVTSLAGYTYVRTDLPDATARHVGVIAQEVQSILPEAVHEDSKGVLSVSYPNLIPLLIESIKDLKKELNEIKAKL